MRSITTIKTTKDFLAGLTVVTSSFLALGFAAPAEHTDGQSHCATATGTVPPAGTFSSYDFFTNYGNYMPRVHCLATQEGRPDWPWITALLLLTGGVIAAYLRIFVFWRKCYTAERITDRDRKLWQLAMLFFVCAITGYLLSIVMFFWPAYRLQAIVLGVLNAFAWAFAMNLRPFAASFRTNRLQRELATSLKNENEALVAAKQSADIASRVKTEFLANMSHEIRTPMTAILGFTDRLADNVTGKENEESIATIRRNGDMLLRIINDILDLSKIEAGKMEIEKIRCNVSRIVADVESLMRVRADAKGLSLQIKFATPIPECIQADPLRLKQILVNFVGNAIKFTEMGSIQIVLRYVKERGQSKIAFAVIDSGIGMDAEQIDRLFLPFAQADTSTTRQYGGTGLGLTISKRIAELMGGDIEVESRRSEGSTFRFTMPTGNIDNVAFIKSPQRELDDTTTKKKVAGDPLQGSRILLAEDGPDNQRLIAHILQKAGAEVCVVENGQQAIEAALAKDGGQPRFDVILMDMQMPIKDGYKATAELREQGFRQPIVALTAHAMAGDREKCIKAGCDDYSTKPINRSQLIHCVEGYLQMARKSSRSHQLS